MTRKEQLTYNNNIGLVCIHIHAVCFFDNLKPKCINFLRKFAKGYLFSIVIHKKIYYNIKYKQYIF